MKGISIFWIPPLICGNGWNGHCRLNSGFAGGITVSKSHFLSAVREKAARTRNKVKAFGSENVGALLHGMRFEPGAQRRSGPFLKGPGHYPKMGGDWDRGCLS